MPAEEGTPAEEPALTPRQAAARRRVPWRKYVFTPELLADLRHRYEETPETCQDIAARHGLSHTTVRKKAQEQRWVKFSPRVFDLSPAVKLDARLAEAEASLSLPRERSERGEGRSAIAESDCTPGWGSSEDITNAGRCETPRPPTPDPSPPLASLVGGGEETAPPPENSKSSEKNVKSPEENSNSPDPAAVADFDIRFRLTAAAALTEAQAQIEALKAARLQLEETGRFAQFAQLGRDLAAITNSLYRIKRIHGGAADGASTDDDMPSDLDARRDALARRIDIIVREWRDAETAGDAERA